MLFSRASIGLYLTTLLSTVAAIPTLSITGSKFFRQDGSQFFIKGVAYQLTESDPLVNTKQCTLDAALMKQLGANTIRVYHVDSSADHTGCMNAFAQAGIYLFVDMDTFPTYIREGSVSSWTQNKSESYRAVVDNFQGFENTAGFFVGNEVLNTLADAGAAPYLLAAAADIKMYIKAKNYRSIPVGYSATDTAVLRPMLQDYVVCRPNETERFDFYSLNSYEWCGAVTTYQTSGYSQLQAFAATYPIPIFFSEDGCNTVPPRDFNDQSAIFGPNMVNTWSGAIIYEWIQETNDYGLISYGPMQGANVNDGSSVVMGYVRQGTPTPVSPDFTNLQGQWATLTPTGVSRSAYTPATTVPSCPAYTAGASGWTVDPSAALPTVGAAGVTSGSPTNVPQGSITSVPSSSGTATANGSGSGSALNVSASTSASTSSASANAAGKTKANPLSSGEVNLIGAAIALFTVGAGAVLLL